MPWMMVMACNYDTWLWWCIDNESWLGNAIFLINDMSHVMIWIGNVML